MSSENPTATAAPGEINRERGLVLAQFLRSDAQVRLAQRTKTLYVGERVAIRLKAEPSKSFLDRHLQQRE